MKTKPDWILYVMAGLALLFAVAAYSHGIALQEAFQGMDKRQKQLEYQQGIAAEALVDLNSNAVVQHRQLAAVNSNAIVAIDQLNGQVALVNLEAQTALILAQAGTNGANVAMSNCWAYTNNEPTRPQPRRRPFKSRDL